MTVHELVTALLDMNPDAQVYVKGPAFEEEGLTDPKLKIIGTGDYIWIE
jgi:hypothetical protein